MNVIKKDFQAVLEELGVSKHVVNQAWEKLKKRQANIKEIKVNIQSKDGTEKSEYVKAKIKGLFGYYKVSPSFYNIVHLQSGFIVTYVSNTTKAQNLITELNKIKNFWNFNTLEDFEKNKHEQSEIFEKIKDIILSYR